MRDHDRPHGWGCTRLLPLKSERLALRIAAGVAWPTRCQVTGPVRLSAVHLIGDLVPTRRFSDLDRLARDDTAGIETQFQAAVAIVERGGPVTRLYDFAADPKVDRP